MARLKRGSVVVITGASAGVGRAAARAFAGRGCAVGLLARGIDGLEAAAREVRDAGCRPLVVPCDVSEPEAVADAALKVERSLGAIDVWVNNAMASVFSPIRQITPEEFSRVTQVTYLGVVWGTLAALRHMAPRGRGTIIQVGSALAFRGIPLQAAYCGAKHAIQGFTESLRSELRHDRLDIRVPMVHLPAINTPQFGWVKSRLPNRAQPVPPIFQPELAADAILFVAENHRHHLYVGWPTIKAVWGNRLAPAVADWYLARHGYESQQLAGEPEDPERPDNLWSPVAGDHGAHGSFDDRARRFSPCVWMSKHRAAIGAGLLGLGLPAIGLAAKWANEKRSQRGKSAMSRSQHPDSNRFRNSR